MRRRHQRAAQRSPMFLLSHKQLLRSLGTLNSPLKREEGDPPGRPHSVASLSVCFSAVRCLPEARRLPGWRRRDAIRAIPKVASLPIPTSIASTLATRLPSSTTRRSAPTICTPSMRTSTASAASRRSAIAGTLRPSRIVLAATVALALLGGVDGTGSAEMACDPSYPAYCEQPTCDPSTADVAGCCAWDGSGDPGVFGQDPPPPCESWYPCSDWCD